MSAYEKNTEEDKSNGVGYVSRGLVEPPRTKRRPITTAQPPKTIAYVRLLMIPAGIHR